MFPEANFEWGYLAVDLHDGIARSIESKHVMLSVESPHNFGVVVCESMVARELSARPDNGIIDAVTQCPAIEFSVVPRSIPFYFI